MTATSTPDKTLERAISDYLAVSRSASLFGEAEYAQAEADAWARLQEALEAAGAAGDVISLAVE